MKTVPERGGFFVQKNVRKTFRTVKNLLTKADRYSKILSTCKGERRFTRVSVKDFFTDWKDTTKNLSESEKMRLAYAIAAKASGEEAVVRGNEKYIFPLYEARIDKEKVNNERAV